MGQPNGHLVQYLSPVIALCVTRSAIPESLIGESPAQYWTPVIVLSHGDSSTQPAQPIRQSNAQFEAEIKRSLLDGVRVGSERVARFARARGGVDASPHIPVQTLPLPVLLQTGAGGAGVLSVECRYWKWRWGMGQHGVDLRSPLQVPIMSNHRPCSQVAVL